LAWVLMAAPRSTTWPAAASRRAEGRPARPPTCQPARQADGQIDRQTSRRPRPDHATPRSQVLGLERFALAHAQGSSHGLSRIIRTAYMEGGAYVPLLREAWGRWRELERRSGAVLLRQTGCLSAAGPGLGAASCFAGALESARRYCLQHEVLGPEEVLRRHPAYHLPPGFQVRAACAACAALHAALGTTARAAPPPLAAGWQARWTRRPPARPTALPRRCCTSPRPASFTQRSVSEPTLTWPGVVAPRSWSMPRSSPGRRCRRAEP
jgi:hypothetical protein